MTLILCIKEINICRKDNMCFVTIQNCSKKPKVNTLKKYYRKAYKLEIYYNNIFSHLEVI